MGQDEASAELEAFFSDFAAATNEGDVDALAAFYSGVSLTASPGFVACTHEGSQLQEVLEDLIAFYAKMGRGPLELVSTNGFPLGEDHHLATTRWRTYFPAKSAEAVELVESYVLQRVTRLTGAGAKPWRIVTLVSHEDERTKLAKRGLL